MHCLRSKVASIIGVGEKKPDHFKNAGALSDFNEVFKQVYEESLEGLCEHARKYPLIVNADQKIYLLQGDVQESFDYFPALYNHMKRLCHIPLTLFVALEPDVFDYEHAESTSSQERELHEKATKNFQKFQAAFPSIVDELPLLGLSEAQLDRNQRLMASCIKFVGDILERKRVSNKMMTEWAMSLRPTIDKNIHDAAICQIDLIHKVTMNIKDNLVKPQDWQFLRVVITGPHMSRNRGLVQQYMGALLVSTVHKKAHPYYAENMTSVKEAFHMLGLHLLDATVGVGFFKDAHHLHSDVLADETTEYLKTLFPQCSENKLTEASECD